MNKIPKKIFFFSFFVFLLRFLISFLPSFSYDMGLWLYWERRLPQVGFSNFFDGTMSTFYMPLFLYWLFLGGKLGMVNEWWIKIPNILFDILSAFLIYSLVYKRNKKLADFSFFAYALNPALVFNNSVWGQVDGILSLLIFLPFYFLIENKKFILSFFFMSLAFLFKPQAFVFLLPFLFILWKKRISLKDILLGITTSLLTAFFVSLPFFGKESLFGVFDLAKKMADYYRYTSLFAYNFWLFVGMWLPDNLTFLDISYFAWGIILFFLSFIVSFLRFLKKNDDFSFYSLVSLTALSSFLFPTRVHERYLIYLFLPLLVLAGFKKSKPLIYVYTILSFLYFLNLYYAYSYHNRNLLRIEAIMSFVDAFSFLIAFFYFFTFLFILFYDEFLYLGKNFFKSFSGAGLYRKEKDDFHFPKYKNLERKIPLLLFLILVFSFFTRVIFLSHPKRDYFDEVYHAFTARAVFHWQKEPWEWWNRAPEGFAYEWTHPPLSKLIMALGMLIFGENPFGWRFPAAFFGTFSIFLTFLLAKEIFKDGLLALFSALFLSLDNLFLVLSRMGMNDIYLVFFSLLTIYLFLKKRDFLSSLALGLALSSKWTAFWLFPILFGAFFVFRKKLSLSLFCFFIFPPIVYVLSYLPMFLTGHNFSIFIEMQKQMWWYHTNLKATHSYTSLWYTWPFLIRPVWFYVGYEKIEMGKIANIYAFGNPVFFWSGFICFSFTFIFAILERYKRLGFAVFSYLFFFVPWSLSPRIMFLYHYLPALPFLSMLIAFCVRKRVIPFFAFFIILLISFFYFYPHSVGLYIPQWLDKTYYLLPSWK